ncbi:endonuclease/exonuclease/phosphatase family protein [Sulfitobacter aestuariivivens]|uniref:Endonuclease/exonuclease/phosphatase family protein n=1 Tax=Sulfitobacter aestuariivivens TaxID=2766981 RepID=A0A927D164_9RHOB|nr:endonuclease/exonuclease/phosphatase family protein [Sulfitobacter aestuariivivens]MBD3663155.1 endonuclease/exonuclease/phosphatase family protein [Sulfitobacter aestuariivivens]
MDLKILSWNVRHFKGPRENWRNLPNSEKDRAQAERVARVAKVIIDQDPDIFAVLEVVGDQGPYKLAEALPDYSFLLTEGDQTQEILVGYKHGLRVFFTQKGEFKENNIHLRPAPVLTVKLPGAEPLAVLFGHFKSMTSPDGWGLRASMFEKVGDLKRALDRHAGTRGAATARFVVMGDLNTMGMRLTDARGDITAADEIARIDKRLARRNLRRLSKSHSATYSGGSTSSYQDADLDHVYVDKGLIVQPEGGHECVVGGWTRESTTEGKDRWIKKLSDHAPIWLTLTDL